MLPTSGVSIRGKAVAFFVLILTAILAGDAAAQAAPRHEGFWIGFGFGAGLNRRSDEENEEPAGGGAVYVRLGGTPSQRFLVGGEILGWVKEENEVRTSRFNATASLLFYPSKAGGPFLKGGIGLSWAQSRVEVAGASTTETDEGGGVTIGAGLDLVIGSNLYITPNLDLLFQRINGEGNTLVLFSVGLTWH